jgi:hypothetical protein
LHEAFRHYVEDGKSQHPVSRAADRSQHDGNTDITQPLQSFAHSKGLHSGKSIFCIYSLQLSTAVFLNLFVSISFFLLKNISNWHNFTPRARVCLFMFRRKQQR